jgi:hypothetical protein
MPAWLSTSTVAEHRGSQFGRFASFVEGDRACGFPRFRLQPHSHMGTVHAETRVCASGATSGEVEPRGQRIKWGEVLGSPEWFPLEGHIVWEWC